MADKRLTRAALDALDPPRPEETPASVYHKLSSSHRRSLAELASQVRDAKTPKARRTATEGLRLGLESLGFKDKWINAVLPRARRKKR